ncbi:hypothetical protein ACG0Z6_04105 [Roseateles sp. BYS180W]|uniref:Secreted protein n=1 Tax=Roseateles rivi TaxID=3299028 RepID=A0ABW7FSW7_9BURK
MRAIPFLLGMLGALASPATGAERPLWYECQGMAFGYVLRQGDTIDFYNRWFNCPRLRVKERFTSTTKLGNDVVSTQDVMVVDNQDHKGSCPFQVMVWTPMGESTQAKGVPGYVEFEGFENLEAYRQEKISPGSTNPFGCAAFLVDAHRRPQLIRPKGPHGRSVREQQRAIAAALPQARGARTGAPSGTRQQEPS